MQRKGFISKTQVSNLSKLMYDIGKLLVGGGIITPYLTNAKEISVSIFVVAGMFFLVGLLLDAAYDRMT